MKKINLIWILLLMVPLVSAVDSTLFFRNSEEVELRRECFNDGDVCDATFGCSLTVYNPNSSVLVDNVSMVRGMEYYNYNVSAITENGQYRSRMTCTDGTDSGSEIFYFSVTPTGDDGDYNLFLIMGLGALVLLSFAYVFKDNIVGFVAGVMFIVLGVYVMIYGIANLSDMYTRAVSFICIGLGLLYAIASAYNHIENSK